MTLTDDEIIVFKYLELRHNRRGDLRKAEESLKRLGLTKVFASYDGISEIGELALGALRDTTEK